MTIVDPVTLARKIECEEDGLYFNRFFFKHRMGSKMIVSPHHKAIQDTLDRVVGGEIARLIINVPPGYSKAIDCETPMWTDRGWVTAGEVRLGDKLMGSNGQWTEVIGVHPQGIKPAYNVSFSDGSSLVACGEHRWSAKRRDRVGARAYVSPWVIKTTNELLGDLRESDGRKKWQIPVLLDGCNDDIELPIDPYLFGCWLGDGNSHYAGITTMDSEIIAAFSDFDPKPFTHQSSGKATSYSLRNGFITKLKSLGVVPMKHIPDVYMRGSHAQRLALLQGLCDTDGWVSTANGQQGIASSNKQLSDDIRALVSSLGGVWRGYSEQPKVGKRSYKTFLTMPFGDVAFRLPRKVSKINPRKACNSPRRFFDSIDPVAPRDMVCFTVAAEDHLFCAGRDFVVTHNTEMSTINMISRGLALNNKARFMHLSYSHNLALLNSSTARSIVKSKAYQSMWPMALRDDSDSKAMWWTEHGGGVYASSAAGQVTGFRAGHMEDGWQGALIIDDPVKPDDAFSDTVRGGVNNRFNETIKSRLALESTPLVIIMQRIHYHDLSGYLLRGGSGEMWHHLNLPVIIDNSLPYPEENTHGIPIDHGLPDGWLWPFKHNESHRAALTSHRRTFEAQYMQAPRRFNAEGALWNEALITKAHDLDWRAWELFRTVVAIDPATTANKDSDETGIIAASSYGKTTAERTYTVDADYSGKYSPSAWAEKAIEAYDKHNADAIVIETNQGGDMAEQTLRNAGFKGRIIRVHASKGKFARAEPISALYEQGKVAHKGSGAADGSVRNEGGLYTLENQLMEYVPTTAKKSPDRLDAMVWALTELSPVGVKSAAVVTTAFG